MSRKAKIIDPFLCIRPELKMYESRSMIKLMSKKKTVTMQLNRFFHVWAFFPYDLLVVLLNYVASQKVNMAFFVPSFKIRQN